MNVAPKRFTYRGCGFFAPKQQDATLSCFEGWALLPFVVDLAMLGLGFLGVFYEFQRVLWRNG